MTHLFDLMTIEMFVGALCGVALASLVGWLLPGRDIAAVQVLLVCAGIGGGVIRKAVSFPRIPGRRFGGRPRRR